MDDGEIPLGVVNLHGGTLAAVVSTPCKLFQYKEMVENINLLYSVGFLCFRVFIIYLQYKYKIRYFLSLIIWGEVKIVFVIFEL